ncbi:MAG: DUF6671 family protein [Pseudomonadota bacterium]
MNEIEYPTRAYAGKTAVLTTMHGKDAAVAQPFRERLDMNVEVAEGIDTDRFGTFTGDVARPGNMLETARVKASAGLDATGAAVGIASEGAYGPDADMPYFASGTELILLVDRERDIEVAELLRTPRTNYASVKLAPGQIDRGFLERVAFPEHALVAQPNKALNGHAPAPSKGIRDKAELASAIEVMAVASEDGLALVQTDMRAHMNPTRMQAIADVAGRLASRLQRRCPECHTPGVGFIRALPGLPCSYCLAPTRLAIGELHGCVKCDYTHEMDRSDGLKLADPGNCDVCNP